MTGLNACHPGCLKLPARTETLLVRGSETASSMGSALPSGYIQRMYELPPQGTGSALPPQVWAATVIASEGSDGS